MRVLWSQLTPARPSAKACCARGDNCGRWSQRDDPTSGAYCSPEALRAVLASWEGEDSVWASTLTPAGHEALQRFLAEACRARYACRATLVRMRLAPKSAPLYMFETPTEHEVLLLDVTATSDGARRLHAFIKCNANGDAGRGGRGAQSAVASLQ